MPSAANGRPRGHDRRSSARSPIGRWRPRRWPRCSASPWPRHGGHSIENEAITMGGARRDRRCVAQAVAACLGECSSAVEAFAAVRAAL